MMQKAPLIIINVSNLVAFDGKGSIIILEYTDEDAAKKVAWKIARETGWVCDDTPRGHVRDRDNSSYGPLKSFDRLQPVDSFTAPKARSCLSFGSAMAPVHAVSGQGRQTRHPISSTRKPNASALKSYAARLKRCGRRFSSPERERTKSRLQVCLPGGK